MEKEMKFEPGKPVDKSVKVYIEHEAGPEMIRPDMDMQAIEAICREKDAAAAAARELNERAQNEMYIVKGIRNIIKAAAFDIASKPDLSAGEMLTVTGQLRSHNQRIDGKRRLLIFVHAVTLVCEDGEPINDVTLEGPICRDPVYRRTPLGREICDVMLAVPRAFRRADYLPCILWGRTAQLAASCRTRDRLRVCGRLQSRVYTKLTDYGCEERVAYEISALTACLPEEE